VARRLLDCIDDRLDPLPDHGRLHLHHPTASARSRTTKKGAPNDESFEAPLPLAAGSYPPLDFPDYTK
jgi:hypothetical protein